MVRDTLHPLEARARNALVPANEDLVAITEKIAGASLNIVVTYRVRGGNVVTSWEVPLVLASRLSNHRLVVRSTPRHVAFRAFHFFLAAPQVADGAGPATEV